MVRATCDRCHGPLHQIMMKPITRSNGMRESGEMYLETILILGKENNTVRATDIASRLGYSKASVSRAVGKLNSEGHIVVGSNGHIALTERGRNIAEKIYERHHVLTEVLSSLGVDPGCAAEDACRIEHVISDEAFSAIKQHLIRFRTGKKDE